ncbi:hypothetical protein BKA63DRAFT_568025 [Paraphoma chrysanthemicola]|nr:hypothetical protein BKA63DRAFT_568025 [Paraphoma chrysanthemicola]
MHQFAALSDDDDDEGEAEMADDQDTSKEERVAQSDENTEEIEEGEDFISPQMRDFVVPHAEDECWGIANYTPPEDLHHLLSNPERKNLLHEALEREAGKATRRRKRPTALQEARKRTRAKRRAMAKEAEEWKSKMHTRCLPAEQELPASAAKHYKVKKQAAKKQTRIPESWNISKIKTAFQRANSFKTPMGPPAKPMSRAQPAQARESSVASQRSIKSETRCTKILDEIQWDCD